jgi:ATP-dependent Clp protease ATP-binding subunit ClpB
MDLNNYTQKAQGAIIQSQQLAAEQNHQTIEPAHLLLALLQQDQGVVPAIVTKITGSPLALKEEIQK